MENVKKKRGRKPKTDTPKPIPKKRGRKPKNIIDNDLTFKSQY